MIEFMRKLVMITLFQVCPLSDFECFFIYLPFFTYTANITSTVKPNTGLCPVSAVPLLDISLPPRHLTSS